MENDKIIEQFDAEFELGLWQPKIYQMLNKARSDERVRLKEWLKKNYPLLLDMIREYESVNPVDNNK